MDSERMASSSEGLDSSRPSGGPAGPSRPRSSSPSDFVSTPAPRNLSHDLLLASLPASSIDGCPCPTLGGIPLTRRLGQGGMGVVYFGEHPRLKIGVAVKILLASLMQARPESVDRFLREAQLAAKVRSPHLVGVLDVNEESGFFYLVMEYIDGCSAEHLLESKKDPAHGGIDERDALEICRAASLGMADAHRAGVLHRDIKPANILIPLAPDGTGHDLRSAKLTDLGLACSVQTDHSLTAEGLALGTPGFMAPEQCLDSTKAGKPADVFGLTASLYELLSGKPPFDAATSMATILATVNQSLVLAPQLSRVTPATRRLLELGLAREPDRRFPDGEALAKALAVCLDAEAKEPDAQADAVRAVEALAKGETVPTPSESRAEAPRSLRHAGWAAAIAFVLVLLVVILATRAPRPDNVPGPNIIPPHPTPPDPDKNNGTTAVADKPVHTTDSAASERAFAEAMGEARRLLNDRQPAWRIPAAEISAVRERLTRALQLRPNDAEAMALLNTLTPPPQWTLPLGEGVEMRFSLMTPGSFTMGSRGQTEDEGPEHRVRFDRSRYIGAVPVTVAQFERFVAETKLTTDAEREGTGFVLKRGVWTAEKERTWRTPGFKQEPGHPVVLVSWNDAQSFARWLSVRAGMSARLPTEAEWEYAARGTEGRMLPWGQEWSGEKANHADAALGATEAAGPQLRLSRDNDGFAFTAPAGTYANASWCGALDLSGNVWQWCQDWYAPDAYAHSRELDPPGPAEGRSRVARGGSWADPPSSCRSTVRHSGGPGHAYSCVGFRLVLEP